MLVLLIVFMVTAPMLAAGLKVDLPQAKQAQPLNPREPIVITIGKDGSLSLGNDVTAKDALVAAVRAKLGAETTTTIHLRGDKQASFGDIVAVMDLLASNGLTHLAIVAHARDKAPVGPGTPVSPAAPVPAQPTAATMTPQEPPATAAVAPANAPVPALK